MRGERVSQAQGRKVGWLSAGEETQIEDTAWPAREGESEKETQPNPPLYHCCNSFLSKCVAFCRSEIS